MAMSPFMRATVSLLQRAAWALLACACLCLPAQAADIEILDVRGQSRDGFYFMDLDARIPLTPDMQDAVESGVPLRFVFDVQLLRTRRYVWDARLLVLRRAMRLERHALAGKYVVHDEVSQQRQVLASLPDALEALGQLREVTLAELDALPTDLPLRGRVRAKLDIEGLPAPMRPVAYLSPSWYLGSGWYTWEVTP